MHWVLQDNMFREAGYQKAIEVFDRFQIPYSIHKVIPFSHELIPDIELEGNVMCLGSYGMRHIAKRKNWTPGVFDLELMNFNEQLKHWGDDMLNADSVVSTFRDAQINDVAFMRPIEDSKIFSGGVFTSHELDDWKKLIVGETADFGSGLIASSLVQVSPIKQIFAEWRYWIVDCRVAARSMYKLGGKPVFRRDLIDSRVDRFVSGLTGGPFSVRHWSPARAFCIDVCDTPDGLKIVEINTINASGFYDADMQSLILALDRMKF